MSSKALAPIEYRETSAEEALLQTAKSFADIFGSCIPILGSAVAKGFEYTLDTLRENRLRDFLSAVSQHLIDMPEEILKSDELAEAIKKCIVRYINEGNKEKRQLLINLNKSLLVLLPSDKHKVFNLYLIFDELFGQLSVHSLQALMQIQDNFKLKSSKGEIIKFLFETQELYGMRCFSELVSQGMLEEEEIDEYRSYSFNQQHSAITIEREKIYRISPFAGVFLAWLRHTLDGHGEMESPQAP